HAVEQVQHVRGADEKQVDVAERVAKPRIVSKSELVQTAKPHVPGSCAELSNEPGRGWHTALHGSVYDRNAKADRRAWVAERIRPHLVDHIEPLALLKGVAKETAHIDVELGIARLQHSVEALQLAQAWRFRPRDHSRVR